MTREEAIEKIKKLQALKEGAAKVSSDGESAQAAKIIDKLQKQFGITMEEVYSYTPAEEEPDADSGQNYDYTGEDKELATKEVQTKLEDGYVDIINKYSYLQDSSLRIQKTLADFDMYGAEVLDDEELMAKCTHFNIDIGGMILDTRRDMEIFMYHRIEVDKEEREKRFAEMRARREARQQHTVKYTTKNDSQGSNVSVKGNSKRKKTYFGFSLCGFVLIFLWALLTHVPKSTTVPEHHDVYKEVQSGERSYDDLNEREKSEYRSSKQAEKASINLSKRESANVEKTLNTLSKTHASE